MKSFFAASLFLIADLVHGQRGSCTTTRKCNECEARDCDNDSQCNHDLICADAHKAHLTAAGYDPRKAYCGANVGRWNWELCYDPSKLCNDSNLCTVDAFDVYTGQCTYTPVSCPPGYECNLADGQCAAAPPCIAVIDENDNYSDADMDARWSIFRAAFPSRRFCLLKPEDPSYSYLYLPTNPDFLSDPLVTYAIVNRDAGDASQASDWLSLCGYTSILSTTDFIALFVDESGSMTRSTVQASLDKFMTDVTTAGVSHCAVYDDTEDWITPFNTLLGVGTGGVCVTA